MPTVSCPSCARALEVDDDYRDWTVRCPHCATEFVPAEVAPAPFEREPRRRRDDRGSDENDDYDRPRRRRRERDEWEFQEATRLAHGPGTWLEVCGWIGGLLLAGGAVYWFIVAADMANGNDDGAGAVLFGMFSALCVVPYTIVMVVGGRKLRSLSSYGWAMTASVVGIVSFFLPCFMCFCAFIPVGFGIWGMVTLNNPVVSRAIDRNSNRRAREYSRGWDD
ncbi:hypothetical protein VT84_38325 [Gemmata sp. SH-PL17]|uniref:hypothetical protein n=1 Tax=Gemmata sp. SH-PL17 TaxID=1630693 RepID=UPI00078CCD1F|nr:hypothetical protein [Gemmata sp. SH-PL17]AMV30312.1 hypothetical protein VT84_38325 [Gemmata sp. SH-PL17]